MYYVFICQGMPFRGDTIAKGQSLGGSETACYYVAKELAALGHAVSVFTSQPDAAGRFDGVDYVYCGTPSQHYPLGDSAHMFLESASCDVLVIQRAAGIMRVSHNAKVALWWLHDLALMRMLPMVRHDIFHYDGVLAVSEWHREQVVKTWEFNKNYVHVLRNGVDATLYDGAKSDLIGGTFARLKLLYQSRYERGIDHLIRPGGIMDRLSIQRPDAHLYVCGYQNEPEHIRPYYDQVRARIREMRNVTMLGYLSKAELAKVQQTCDILVYPGDFEETSCISAMEAQHAGLPILASDSGALFETCNGGGAVMVPLVNGKCDEATFVESIMAITGETLAKLAASQKTIAPRHSWKNSVERLTQLVDGTFLYKQQNSFSMLRSMLDRSDVKLAEHYAVTVNANRSINCGGELNELLDQYEFQNDLANHYDEDHALAALQADENLDITENRRFQFVVEGLSREFHPSNVLDYGCQKGHYVFSLAKLFGDSVRITGVDVSQRHVDWANKKFAQLGLADFVTFKQGDALSADFDYSKYGKFDSLVLGEVIEHVPDPYLLCKKLESLLVDGARVVVTTPYGEWEGKDYNDRPDQKRYHLHHFELNDLREMFGHHEDYCVVSVAAGNTIHGTLGSYVTSFTWKSKLPLAKPVDMTRKLREFIPRQTLSFCALAKDSERTILRSLISVKDVVDEFIIALDKKTTDGTRQVLEKFRDQYCRFKRFVIYDAESPLEIGFDEARNRTIEAARGDWIMWMDNDEDLIHPERLPKYLRNNMFDGYGIAQNHMSADPVGILTTDWPVRVFRRVPYISFRGVVHEHPDDTENVNHGPRCPAQLVDLHILHHGYTTEDVRRARFGRNLPLIKRDRKQYPDRQLGRLLWMRDLSHMCMFSLERTGGQITNEMREFATAGLAEWDALMAESDKPIVARMLRDGLEFYSTLVGVLGHGFEAQFQIHTSLQFGQSQLEQGPRKKGRFINRAHFDKYLKLCVDEQAQFYDHKYL